MKVMTILGSPRRFGNTAQVLEWVEGRLREEGHSIVRANIWEHHIGHCKESHQCRYPQSAACGTPDDAAKLFEMVLDADRVLIASPVFSWGFPAPMKALLDRFYCLSGYHEDPGHAILLEDKPIALMMTCGGEESENHPILSRVYRNMMAFFGAREVGFWLIPKATTPDAFGEDVRKIACEIAERLIAG
jgi:multimeric flavodoxin WrbA